MQHEQQEVIESIRQELADLKEKMNKIYRLCIYGQNATCSPKLFIPYGETWISESPTQCLLQNSNNESIRVNVSSTYQNELKWQPQWLFNGKSELSDQGGWASNTVKPSFITINFLTPIEANVLTITSRVNSAAQAPTSFEIWGSDDSFNFILLGGFVDVVWAANQQRFFSFDNNKSYHVYNIYSTFKFSNSKSSIKAFLTLRLYCRERVCLFRFHFIHLPAYLFSKINIIDILIIWRNILYIIIFDDFTHYGKKYFILNDKIFKIINSNISHCKQKEIIIFYYSFI